MKVTKKAKLIIIAGFPAAVLLVNFILYAFFGILMLPPADDEMFIARIAIFIFSAFITALIINEAEDD